MEPETKDKLKATALFLLVMVAIVIALIWSEGGFPQ